VNDRALETDPYVKATIDCRPEDIGEVGGKAVGLGSLLRAGQLVPASFVVTATAYRSFIAHGADGLTTDLTTAISSAYADLCEKQGATVAVAVRSSATLEDSVDASFAGQFQTHLGARGAEQVIAEVERCWLSAFDPHVGAYQREQSGDERVCDVAVVVQELVDARSAGVMFTQHTHSGDRSIIVIEASFGLGESVVGGEVVPDLYEVNKITHEVVRRTVGSKPHEYRLHQDGDRVERRLVDDVRATEWSITDEQVVALSGIAVELERSLGRGLDVEWAVGAVHGMSAGDALFTLQVRPITVDARRGDPYRTRQSQNEPASISDRNSAATPDTAIDAILGRLSRYAPDEGPA
jgi:pyruvate,water dikinase